jgi:hypothetical protein
LLAYLLAAFALSPTNRDFVKKAQANMIELMDRYPAPEPSAGGNVSAKASWDRLQSEVSIFQSLIWARSSATIESVQVLRYQHD